jgi:two-component system NtrC family sensor kinase
VGDRPDPRLLRPVLRWVLILATASLLVPAGLSKAPGPFDLALLSVFVLSNVAFMAVPRSRRLGPAFDYSLVIADTFLVSSALFHADLDGGRFLLVFFMVLLLSAVGPDLVQLVAGASLLAGLYIYLVAGAGAVLDPWSLLTRVPFLYVVALYYGHIAAWVREREKRQRRTEREMEELQAFVEVTSATTSTLDLHQVLFVVVQRVARLVNAMRCSILQVDEVQGHCEVMASSDDPELTRLELDLRKYPEVRRAIETRQPVVINDIASESLLDGVRPSIERLGFESILVLPLMHGESLLGMLFLRAARDGRHFRPEEIASCKVVANASANALRNAMLYDEIRVEARGRRETAQKLQQILDHFPDLICTTDNDGRVTEFSRGGDHLLGIGRAEVLGRSLEEIFPDPETRLRLRRLLREGESIRNVETSARHSDGSMRDVLVAASPLKDETGRVYGTVGIVQNITELKAARGHLAQAEKLTALGEVVSGVAHELNNPLAGVLGYAQLLMRAPMEARQQRSVERILDAALRCQRIVQNLLAFSRRYPSEKRYLGLNGLIEKTLDIKEYDLRANRIRIVRDLQPDLPKTMLDFNQMQQVLLNLINNAQYAMATHKGQGTLTVMTRESAGMIEARIHDDGPGIPRENQARIFDPFFTTKPAGEGTGLGLSISYGIVRDHGGRIWVDSEPSRGTTLVLEIPVRRESLADGRGESTTHAADLAGVGRALRVLVVDDEPIIQDLLVDALSSSRHSVDTASGGEEALRKLERGAYDVILLDLKMPDMDGRQVFETLSTRWPDLRHRVVFSSGDTVHPETRDYIQKMGRPCLDKPFRLESLAEVLSEVVRASGPPRAATGT